ncbi:hypothetical protein MLD38_030356 [Melastoma candidum]|uniref:Uncharacterized protein n=1 Tax=Melastoma candidum TaxID=119954 RepID=A0ACB9MLK5_9MYRT|nr:hypothetical protein MLD38_030356 [Melastoma candidum]
MEATINWLDASTTTTTAFLLPLLSLFSFLFLPPFPCILGWRSPFHCSFAFACVLAAFLVLRRFCSRPCPVYLVDFSCLSPPAHCRVPFSSFLENVSLFGTFDWESIEFMSKILLSSGQSEETHLPPPLHYIPPKSGHDYSIEEAHLLLFSVMDDLLAKTGLSPRDIDILIVNCSGFCPQPSLASIIVNSYSLRDDVKSYNISGMGCSAGAIGVDMAKRLLGVHKGSNAIVLSTEVLSTGWYTGRDRPKLLLNCLFRMGSAAVLLTNRMEARKSSKYKVLHTVRTQRSFEDRSYYSAFREEDSDGHLGVTLNKDLLQVAGETLRSNITILGSEILSWSEKLRHVASVLRKRFVDKSSETYIPRFNSVVQHFCLPTSGRPVIREIGKGLNLGEGDMEAALATLHRFGNQSSSSLWYELAFMEAQGRVKEGDKVWQLGMGSGPKCTSVILQCVGPIVGEAQSGPWAEALQRYSGRHERKRHDSQSQSS